MLILVHLQHFPAAADQGPKGESCLRSPAVDRTVLAVHGGSSPMFPNGNVGLENSKFYEDVPARGHLIGRAATGSCRKRVFVTRRVWHRLSQSNAPVISPARPAWELPRRRRLMRYLPLKFWLSRQRFALILATDSPSTFSEEQHRRVLRNMEMEMMGKAKNADHD